MHSSLSAQEAAFALHGFNADFCVHFGKTLLQAIFILKGRCKEALADIEMIDKPVCPRVFSRNIEAAAEDSALFQHPESLPVGGFLIRKGMETVHGEYDIKSLIWEGQLAHISLLEGNVVNTQPLCFFCAAAIMLSE